MATKLKIIGSVWDERCHRYPFEEIVSALTIEDAMYELKTLKWLRVSKTEIINMENIVSLKVEAWEKIER